MMTVGLIGLGIMGLAFARNLRRAGHVLAEMGTWPIDAKLAACDRIAPKGVVLLDCPMSGTGAQAETTDLVVYMSGPTEAAEALLLARRSGLDLNMVNDPTRAVMNPPP